MTLQADDALAASYAGYLAGNEDVPICVFGWIEYRKLTAHLSWRFVNRYGRIMQCIAGMHLPNFSFDQDFWSFS